MGNFAANQTGLECLKMIESQVNAKFAASTDATGNVASNGNWELERGRRNVAPIYFYEDKLGEFTTVMAPGKKDHQRKIHEVKGYEQHNDRELSMEELLYMHQGSAPKDPHPHGKPQLSRVAVDLGLPSINDVAMAAAMG